MIACRWYLAREGWSNPNDRMLLLKGKINNPDEVLHACEHANIDLETNYPAVLRKLEGQADA